MLILFEKEASKSQLNQKIADKISKITKNNQVFSIYYAYFLDLKSDLDEKEILIAKKLLLSDNFSNQLSNKKYLLITPRIGVESSWGSKARDIFYASGINKLKAIEQVKLFIFDNDIDDKLVKSS